MNEAGFSRYRAHRRPGGSSQLANIDRVTVDGIPCTSATRALIDNADELSDEALEVAFESARRLRLPRPVRQHVVVVNGRRCRLDFAWVDVLVALECDGFESHGYRLAWKRDRRRLAALEHAGWRVVSATWEDVTQRPAETVARLASP